MNIYRLSNNKKIIRNYDKHKYICDIINELNFKYHLYLCLKYNQRDFVNINKYNTY